MDQIYRRLVDDATDAIITSIDCSKICDLASTSYLHLGLHPSPGQAETGRFFFGWEGGWGLGGRGAVRIPIGRLTGGEFFTGGCRGGVVVGAAQIKL